MFFCNRDEWRPDLFIYRSYAIKWSKIKIMSPGSEQFRTANNITSQWIGKQTHKVELDGSYEPLHRRQYLSSIQPAPGCYVG